MSDSSAHQGGSLLQGSYDEEASAQSFAQALMEWRSAGKTEKMWTNPSVPRGISTLQSIAYRLSKLTMLIYQN